MIPSGGKSTTTIQADFMGGRNTASNRILDYESGGNGLNDASGGMLAKVWRARIVGNDVVVDSDGVAEETIYTSEGLTEISLSFDQNMSPVLAFVQNQVSKFRWWDATIPGWDVITLTDAVTPRVSLDDKREDLVNDSDIVLAYVKDNKIYYRLQSDRFTVEYLFYTGPPSGITNMGLVKIGLNEALRFQFEITEWRGLQGYTDGLPEGVEHGQISITEGSLTESAISRQPIIWICM